MFSSEPNDLDARAAATEQVARMILATVSANDPDELIHHPWQKSWEQPTWPRWQQFQELALEILALLAVALQTPATPGSEQKTSPEQSGGT